MEKCYNTTVNYLTLKAVKLPVSTTKLASGSQNQTSRGSISTGVNQLSRQLIAYPRIASQYVSASSRGATLDSVRTVPMDDSMHQTNMIVLSGNLSSR